MGLSLKKNGDIVDIDIIDDNYKYLDNLEKVNIITMPSEDMKYYSIKTNTLNWFDVSGVLYNKIEYIDSIGNVQDIDVNFGVSCLGNIQISQTLDTVRTSNFSMSLLTNLDYTLVDGSFNIGTSFDGTVNKIIVQTDGKILVSGEFLMYDGNIRKRLVRLNSDGTDDISFSNNLGSGFNDGVYSIVKQADGKILIGGAFSTFNNNSRFLIVRLNDDGTEDTTFYNNLGSGFGFGVVYNISIQDDGKILLGGLFDTFNNNTRNFLIRLNSNGTEDTSFYANLGNGFDATINDINIQTDGKILVGGVFTALNGNTRNELIRLNADGTEDTSFYNNLGSGFSDVITSINLQPDGKILVGGLFNTFNNNSRLFIVRLNADGTEDTSFYNNLGSGFVSGSVTNITIQTDGKILVGGEFTTFNSNTRNRIIRLNSDGTEDTTFYNNLGSSFDNIIYDITIQTDGKILVGGIFNSLNGDNNIRYRIVRLNSGGTDNTISIDKYLKSIDDISFAVMDNKLYLSSNREIDTSVYSLQLYKIYGGNVTN